ncbi:MAG TPA: hypothetical protein VN627_02410 [Novosphingobium sp.]|nr:hypothetical protein [Novosphingobium sp.]
MSLFDQLAGQAGGLNLGGIAGRFGLSEEQVRSAAALLLPRSPTRPSTTPRQATTWRSRRALPWHPGAAGPALISQAQANGAEGGVLGSLLRGLG